MVYLGRVGEIHEKVGAIRDELKVKLRAKWVLYILRRFVRLSSVSNRPFRTV